MYDKISAFLNPKHFESLSYLDVTKDQHPHRITDKHELENELIQYHKTHFSQATQTPFAQADVFQRFGYAADTDYATDFYQGDPTELNKLPDGKVKKFLTNLQPTAGDPPKINTIITVDNVKQGFKIWTERTSTSPSGRKLPLYKIWLKSYDNDDDVLQGDEFFQIITDIINISQHLQYPVKRWLDVHNFFIPKDKGVFKTARLRTLHNIEAELNLVRRELISRRLVANAEHFDMVPMNNSGGRKGRSAIDVVMLKYFTLGIMHMQRRNCAITDCDARACYDRILPTVLYFTYHKMGLPVHECKWIARALVNMNYHMIKTYGP